VSTKILSIPGVRPETAAKIEHCLEQDPKIKRTVLFGSRALGTFKNGSDIDLCFEGDDVNLDTVSRFQKRIDDLLIPYKVDVCVFNQLTNSALKDHIQLFGIEIYRI
jgi:uncharacterized protein